MALRENVYLMFICLVNKIPLFLSGNPGCSKTLSINLIIEAMRGKDSNEIYLQHFPIVYANFY